VNCIDAIFFQAELTPDKLAIVAHGAVIPYGRLAQGIVSAQQKFVAAGIGAGQTVGIHVAHPIDHFILTCALYRLKAASAPIHLAPDAYLDNLAFDAVLLDSVNPAVIAKQPRAKLILVDPTFFQDKVAFSVAERTSSRRDVDPDWVCRITASSNDAKVSDLVKTTSRALEAQLIPYCLSAASDWERMISLSGLHTNAGFLLGLSALWFGRTVCFADVVVVRNLIVAYRHHYLVGSTQEMESLLKLQDSDFVAMPSLRGAYVEGRTMTASLATRCLTSISSNTVCGYAHPDVGVVASAAASLLRDVDGAVGFAGSWADLEVLADDRRPVAAGQAGELRIRVRDMLGSPRDADWFYPGQRAQVLKNNLLVVHGSHATV
jgi:hypothetical protein